MRFNRITEIHATKLHTVYRNIAEKTGYSTDGWRTWEHYRYRMIPTFEERDIHFVLKGGWEVNVKLRDGVNLWKRIMELERKQEQKK